jgi:hypothetical protein
MVKRSIWQWASLSFLVAAGFRSGVAVAQDAGAAAAPAAAEGGERRGDAEVQTERRANLTAPEQMQEAGHIVDIMAGLRRRVSDMLDRARQERDIIKVNCLNDKLTQIDVTLRSAREHQELLGTAVGINNDGQRNHEYALMTIFRQRAESLEAEARQCIGEEAGGFGEGTTVSVRVNPNIPTQDTTQYPVEPITPERPLVTSPIR